MRQCSTGRLAALGLAVALFSCLAVRASRAQGVITTVAGTEWSFQGDGKPAVNAPLGRVGGAAVDADGNVFVSDPDNNFVAKISAGGILTVVAGNGIYGFSGDGGLATNASFSGPAGVAVDKAGNLYIVDAGNAVVRKVTPSGIISTIAGRGLEGFSGDNGPALLATFSTYGTQSIAVDGNGNLYLADPSNNRIRKINANGLISTVAGSGAAGFSGDNGPATSALLNFPTGVALDSAGNLYIADNLNYRIRKVTPSGTISTVAGGGTASPGDGGPATAAQLSQTFGVAVGPDDSVYLTDTYGHRIRRVNQSGVIATVAGTGAAGSSGDGGVATAALLNAPEGLAVDRNGNVYIADTQNTRVRKVASNQNISTIAGNGLFRHSGDGGPATSATLNFPSAVALDPSGNLYISVFGDFISKVSPAGIITTFAGSGHHGYSGDGGPATGASFSNLGGVAADASGNVYIADEQNNRIRKVDRSGTISTFAGTGEYNFTGDNGPATSAALNQPSDVAVDVNGNVYIADSGNNRVRKVTPSGVITTVAGNGSFGSSGDGGPATGATLGPIGGLAVDASGNLFLADPSNNRVRKVTPGGIISTVAGNGAQGYSGDDGPAIFAKFNQPADVAVDASGNLYIADSANQRIRKVAPDGTLTTAVGNGEEGFFGDGGPPANASLANPVSVAVDSAGNIYIADEYNGRVRAVIGRPPSFTVSPASLQFTARAGAADIPPQQLTLTSSVNGLVWSGQVSTRDGGTWLAISPASGTAPGVISATVDATKLAPGTYNGTVNLQAPLANPALQSVSVTLTVQAAAPARLAVDPPSLTFQTLSGSNPSPQALRVSNAGGGSLSWTASVQTSSGGNWLSVNAASGSASSSASSALQVGVSASTLAAGVYSGTVIVSSEATNETMRIPVSLLVSQASQSIVVSQSGLLFTGVEGGAVIPPQSFGVLNSGAGVMNWTAQATALSGGSWLTVSPASGTSDAASLQVPLANVGVNITGVKAGQYSGLIQISSATANNSPQFVTVQLNVLPAGSNPGVLVRPTGLIFATQAGTSSPSSQAVTLGAVVPGSVDVVSGLLTRDGGTWLQTVPRNFALTPSNANQKIVVQPSLGLLAPGIYRGAITLLFGDGSPAQVVNILFLVVPRSGGATISRSGSDKELSPQADSNCVPKALLAIDRSLGSNFFSKAGAPTTMGAQVIDDCGNPVTDASVVVRFSNSDAPVTLVSLRDGTYEGTWNPSNQADQVAATARVEHAGFTPVELQSVGAVGGNNAAGPQVSSGGIVNAASFAQGDALAPGSIVSVFGRNLGSAAAGASVVPLPTTLAGVSLNVSGADVPLFYGSGGQINAQLPFTLAPNSRPSVVVRTRDATGKDTVSVPQTITIADARPAIFSINSQGTGQGAILDAKGNLANSAAAVAAGEVVQIFATGLGVTTPLVASGQPAPSAEPLARVSVTVQATVGGVTAPVQFAGLAPGFVGLYQVNVQIPSGVTPGTDVPLVLLQNGVPSNTVTLAVR